MALDLESLVRPLSRCWRQVHRIVRRSDELSTWSDRRIDQLANELRWRALGVVPLTRDLSETFALVREVSRRELALAHYPVQLYCGLNMISGVVAEMQTGEGKTLSMALPAVARALAGRGCHVLTSNEYLAERDARTLAPAYRRLGLSVGCVLPSMDSDSRRAAYACDITYGTASEMGFDYLRDQLRREAAGGGPGEPPVQRGHYCALIDEADSLLIDEGRTPLIIGLERPADDEERRAFEWCDQFGRSLRAGVDFLFDSAKRSVDLTECGCHRILLAERPAAVRRMNSDRVFHRVETALRARLAFMRDRDYVVVDDEVRIIDESTGRALDGRKWQDGLHQAVEIKEGTALSPETGVAAKVTVQRFFRQYEYLAGMTGTAVSARSEFLRGFQLRVVRIPTHRVCRRNALPPRVFQTLDSKYLAIAGATWRLLQEGRAVLIGTSSVSASEALGRVLQEHQIPHRILNARLHEVEAEIVAEAGQARRVTVATNMAGRGTDIHLADSVRAAGGLHVICSELHSSPRIDRQLIGRSARQGDPGSYQFFLSLEDELLAQSSLKTLQRWRTRSTCNTAGELSGARRWLAKFRRLQRQVERRHQRDRRRLWREEGRRWRAYRSMGLDPCLDLTED